MPEVVDVLICLERLPHIGLMAYVSLSNDPLHGHVFRK